MEAVKTKPVNRKGFNWDALFGFTTEIAKLAIVAGVSAYVSESVRSSMNKRRDESNVLDFSSARKAA